MKASQFFISTLKEAPADAEIVSHQLMMRAGMIKRLGAGIYTYMPMGLRVIRKVEAIVREEMNRAGAVELLMPVVQPAELWQEIGPLGQVRARSCCASRTATSATSSSSRPREEVITDIARQEMQQLPAAADELLPDPDQVPRRAPAALRRDARARVHDEGRLLLRPRRRRPEGELPRCTTPTRASSPLRPAVTARWRPTPARSAAPARTSSRCIADTGEDAIVYCPTVGLRGQHGAGRGAAAHRERAAPPPSR